ncbi:MAG: tetratricopeptide repeat protein [Deltaproteobacteria bacterium]|nr:tetratricopeptide repeat protein [Deltaproteobacteria bacterium]
MGHTQPSIAVLAFEDLSPQKDQEYFCDGIAEEIINNLAQMEGIKVASRTSSFAYKSKPEDIRNIGKHLDVQSVLEGSVRKADDRLRITTQLIDVADGCHLWSEQFDRKMTDIFDIQVEIARKISQTLRIKLSDKEKHAIKRVPTENIDAYDFYLRGRQFFYRHKRQYMQHAIEMFSRAIELDAGYVHAYAGKADCHSYSYYFFGGSHADLEQAAKDSETALELDPKLAEAHAARGLAVSLIREYEEAEQAFENAIRLNPNLFEAYYFYASTCFLQGKFDKAIALFKDAERVNPEDYQAPAYLAFLYQMTGQTEKMAPVLQQALQKIEKRLALNPDDSRALYLGAGAWVRLGDQPKAMEWIKRLAATERDEPHLLYGIACLYSMTGKIEESIYYLNKAVEAGFAYRLYLERDGDFDPIRSHPGYKTLIETLKMREKGAPA